MADESEVVVGPMMGPAHPGEIVRHDCLEPLGLTVTRVAGMLGDREDARLPVVQMTRAEMGTGLLRSLIKRQN